MSLKSFASARPGRTGAVLICVTTLAMLAACSSGGGGSGGAAGPASGSFTEGLQASYLAHLLPGDSGDTNVDYAIWTPLTEIDPGSGRLADAVAQSVTSADQRVWTIKIRHGWTFQNGQPVTAQSFADSWNATAYGPNTMTENYLFSIISGYTAMNPTSGKPSASKLSGVKVIDPYTLRVTLSAPLSLFPYVISGTPFAPLPKAALGHLASFDKKPIGDGPYEVTGQGLAPGVQQLKLQRYARYAGQPGKAKTIGIALYQNPGAAYTSFQSGAIDMTLVSGNDLASAAQSYPGQLVRATAPAIEYLGFPLWDKRFASPQIRQAFSLAVDRDAIVRSLLHGFGQATGELAPKSIPGGGQPVCSYCGYDPAKARQLLASAGGWHGPLTLWTDSDPTDGTVLQAIANQLRTNLGISDISIKQQSFDQLYPNLSAHKVDGPTLLYMAASYPHYYAMVQQLFSPASLDDVTGYSNPQVTALINRAAASGNPGQVISLTQQAAKAALGGMPIAPLYFPQTGLVHSKQLGSIEPEFLGDAHLASVTGG